ncbi:MAG: hypothetical protein FAF05_06915 [Epsilonproteobacteria bacterium]|nr:hypothetical protein [Campylobacterota bacterium]
MNNYPKFFDAIKPIALQDKLAAFLGAFENGLYEVSYLDVVKNAGHSCPTVAGAYLLCQKGLEALYGDQPAQRGEIEVAFKESELEGVAGVIANVVSHITGATDKTGFKGIGGNFVRHSLMHFEANIDASIKLTRTDTQQSVTLLYNPNTIKPDPKQQEIMQKIMQNIATQEDKKEFATLWQDRVKRIFQNSDQVITVV